MEFHEKAIYSYIIGLLQLASKRVRSGSDCLKMMAASPHTSLGELTAPQTPSCFNGWDERGKRRGEGEEEKEGKGRGEVGEERSWYGWA